MKSNEKSDRKSTLRISQNTDKKCAKQVSLARRLISVTIRTYHIGYSEEIFL